MATIKVTSCLFLCFCLFLLLALYLVCNLSEIFLPNTWFSILSMCILSVFSGLFLCIFLYLDLPFQMLHFQICLDSNLAFQNEAPHKLLLFKNFLSTPKFVVKILNNIRSALWRTLYNIIYQFYNKLLTSFLSKIV